MPHKICRLPTLKSPNFQLGSFPIVLVVPSPMEVWETTMLGSNFGVLRYLPCRFRAKVTKVTWYLNNRTIGCIISKLYRCVWKLMNILDPPNPVVNHHVSICFPVDMPGPFGISSVPASHGPGLRLWEVEEGPVGLSTGPPVYEIAFSCWT